MLPVRMHTVELPDRPDVAEWRIAPTGEPLASCAIELPVAWSAEAPPWVPPPRGGRSELCRWQGPTDDDVLIASVMRFGVEVDGLEALRDTVDGPLSKVRWTGLPLVEATEGDARWAVIHAGPALFALRATGAAIEWLPAAARSVRSLTGWPPIAESLTALRVGPFSTRRIAGWTLAPKEPMPHGYARRTLVLDDPREVRLARIEVMAVDRRVFPGFDPHVALAAADGRLNVLGYPPARRAAEPGPSGPTRCGVIHVDDVVVEHRRALRQVGRCLVVVDGLWRPDAPIARLNGRRHQDILLATAERGGDSR